jgi:hypothetical protein
VEVEDAAAYFIGEFERTPDGVAQMLVLTHF